jgi:inorganic triphosphatase YgiF
MIMPIEIEISYKMKNPLIKERLISDITTLAFRTCERYIVVMSAEYYDTPSQALSKIGITLRRRLENGKSFVSVKTNLPGSGRILSRSVWECEDSEIGTAIGTLADMGAPRELLELASSEGYVTRGRYEYTRNSLSVLIDDETSAAVIFDEGVILADNKQKDFSEVLFKLLFGDQTKLEEFAVLFEEKYELTRELSGKYDRALRLVRSRST